MNKSIDPQSDPIPKAQCLDCGKPYADFSLDLLLPRWQWLQIHPADSGVLCANCIVDRASKLAGAVAVHAVIGVNTQIVDNTIH